MYEQYDRGYNGALVHRTAVVANWAMLGEGCIVHPFAVVGRLPDTSAALAREPARKRHLRIGARSVIGVNAIVYADVEIDDDCLVGDFASIREGSRIGRRCVIGRQVTINYNAQIADCVRLQDGTHVTGECRIGEGCFFGVGVVTSNDRNVTLGEGYHFPEPRPPVFGVRVMVGSGANILAGVTVGDGALIGAGAVVVKDVPAGAKMIGPAALQRRVYQPGEQQAEALSDAQAIWERCTR